MGYYVSWRRLLQHLWKGLREKETSLESREIMDRQCCFCLLWRTGCSHSHVVGKSGSCLYSSHTGANANTINMVLLFYPCVFSGFFSSRSRISAPEDQ